MSFTLTLSDNSSILQNDFFPPIELPNNYSCGLVDFQTYNSIPNVDQQNNLLHVGSTTIKIPDGSYEISDIADFCTNELRKSGIEFSLTANNNTLLSQIKSSHIVYFNKQNTIGSLLGFSQRELKPNIFHMSDLPVDINKVNVIRIECNIIHGSYMNGIQTHTIHEFYPTVGPGYKIIEVPRNIIYFPLNTREIRSISIKLIDQDNNLINFRGGRITLRIHLRPQT